LVKTGLKPITLQARVDLETNSPRIPPSPSRSFTGTFTKKGKGKGKGKRKRKQTRFETEWK